MEMHHLQYVTKLAKSLHFSKAAMDLNITQPSLSQQIIKIENELGIKLFERKTRSVELTAAGAEFIVYANKILADWKHLHEAMLKHSDKKKETLRIGILLNMAKLDITTKILNFQKEYPHIHVTFDEIVGSLELIKQLEKNYIDVVFYLPSSEIDLDEKVNHWPVLHGRVAAIVQKGHHLAANSKLLLQELENERLIFPIRAHSLYKSLLEACRNSGFEPMIVASQSRAETAIDMVNKGLGIALLSSLFVEASMCKSVVAIPVEPIIHRNIEMAYLQTASNLPAIRLFRDFILS